MKVVSVTDWNLLCTSFEHFFKDLGHVTVQANAIHFDSFDNDVETSLNIFQSGDFAASMPLHGVDSSLQNVVFDSLKNEVRLTGTDIDYTYRIPPQLLRHRGE